jgi:hypothetical protein
MEPGQKPASIFEALLKWVLVAFFSVDLFLVAPVFGSDLRVELPRGFPGVEPAAVISGGSRLAHGVAQALGFELGDRHIQSPPPSSSGSGAIVSAYAPMVVSPTMLPIHANNLARGAMQQETSTSPSRNDSELSSPISNTALSETPLPTITSYAVSSLTSADALPSAPTGIAYSSPTPAASSTLSPNASATKAPTRTLAKTVTRLPALPPGTSGREGNFYVSPSGDDANPGTIDKPWRTLSRVNSGDFLPGDVVSLQRGGTWSGGLAIRDSGVRGNPITFRAYGQGEPPALHTSEQWGSTVVVGASWIVVDGLRITAAWDGGVRIGPDANHNIVRNSEIEEAGIGVQVFGRHNLITHNDIHDLHMIVNTQGGDDDYGAVGIALFNSHNEVSYNTMARCAAPSKDYGIDGGAVELYGPNVDNSSIHHNYATESDGFIEIGGGSAAHTLVAYNVSQDNGQRFAWLNLEGKYASEVLDLQIENNTIVEADPLDRPNWAVFVSLGSPTLETFSLRKNIVYVNNISQVAASTGDEWDFTHANNIYFSTNPEATLGFDLGSEEFIADPLFINVSGKDFHLQGISPAIDTGLDLGHTADFEDETIPVGGAADIGAFEYAEAR